jgi:hypothetical protein
MQISNSLELERKSSHPDVSKFIDQERVIRLCKNASEIIVNQLSSEIKTWEKFNDNISSHKITYGISNTEYGACFNNTIDISNKCLLCGGESSCNCVDNMKSEIRSSWRKKTPEEQLNYHSYEKKCYLEISEIIEKLVQENLPPSDLSDKGTVSIKREFIGYFSGEKDSWIVAKKMFCYFVCVCFYPMCPNDTSEYDGEALLAISWNKCSIIKRAVSS